MVVMRLTHCLCLIILVFCHYVALENSETEDWDQQKTEASFDWPSGIVPYLIEPHFDDIIVARIRAAMNTIESYSCVVFKDMKTPPPLEPYPMTWLLIQNPDGVRECSHSTLREQFEHPPTKAILILGYDCMQHRDILHALLHVLAFNDEVTHPQRDMYVRVMWENIQPKYRSLFWVRTGGRPHKLVEYDPMSIMHFHNRAYSVNGGATIVPLNPELRIIPSNTLSQLDIMKLRLAYGHECNKRKVGSLLDTCQDALRNSDEDKSEDKSGDKPDDKSEDKPGNELEDKSEDEPEDKSEDESVGSTSRIP